MKVCIFGNSHVAAFKSATPDLAERFPEFEIDYFGVAFPHADGMSCNAEGHFGVDRSLALAHGLRPKGVARAVRGVNGREVLDLNTYDAAFLVGHYIKIKDIFRMIAHADVDGFTDRARPALMSRAAFDAMVKDIIDQHIPASLANMARATRTYVSLIPLLSGACLDDDGTEYDYLRTLADDADAITPLIGNVQAMVGERFRALGLQHVPQPDGTVTKGCLTSVQFSEGSRRLVGGELHERRDHLHMNETFALACFEEFVRSLSART